VYGVLESTGSEVGGGILEVPEVCEEMDRLGKLYEGDWIQEGLTTLLHRRGHK